MARITTLNVYSRISLCVLAVGIALVAYMITVEGELGALPLLFVLVGTAGYSISRYRLSKHRATSD